MNSQSIHDDKNILERGDSTQGRGCLTLALYSLAGIWIIFGTLFTQAGGWFIEQMVFEGSLGIPPIQWAVVLGYSIYIILPFAILINLKLDNRIKSAFRSFLLAGLAALIFVPGRVIKITNEQSLGIYQLIAITIVFCITFFFLRRWNRNISIFRSNQNGDILLVVVFGAALGIPWILWGALGSPLDVILNILVGLSFGVIAGMIISSGIYKPYQSENHSYRFRTYFSDGYVSFLTLMILVTGLGQNGNQWLLLMGIPVIGWTCAGLIGYLFLERQNSANGVFMGWISSAILIGITTAWILAFYDPDELMLVIGSDHGEILQWAIRSGVFALVIGIFINILVYIWFRNIKNSKKFTRIVTVISIVCWLGCIGLYLFRGRSGFYGEWIFVIFKNQADISSLSSIPDYRERRDEIYRAMVAQADESQKDIINILDRFKIPYHRYYIVNGLEIKGGPILKLWLTRYSDVDRVLDSPHLRPLPAAMVETTGEADLTSGLLWNLKMVGADRVWDDFGVKGKGVIIGQSDSGVQGDHPELADSYRGSDGNDNYNWFDPWFGSIKPTDIGGHGTHTLGIILGDHVGVAPDAQWIGCVNLARNLGNPAYYLDCWQFMFAPFPQNGDPLLDGKPSLGADILNNSWGCPWVEGCDAGTFLQAVNAMRAAGIFVEVSAGNSGYSGCGSVDSPPAIYEQVYSVGAINKDGNLTNFSSLGPVEIDGSDRIKPDIVAPGEDVLSSFPGSSYQYASGTSMAGPHVTGVVALMWSANKKLLGNVEQTEMILDQSTSTYQGMYPNCVIRGNNTPNNAIGYGIVDAYKAVELAIAFDK